MPKGTIIFKYTGIQDSVTKIEKIAEGYATAGNTLITALNTATVDWKGASKNKFDALLTNPGGVKEHITVNIPNAITALADMLTSNAAHMQSADDEIAKNIPDSLGSGK